MKTVIYGQSWTRTSGFRLVGSLPCGDSPGCCHGTGSYGPSPTSVCPHFICAKDCRFHWEGCWQDPRHHECALGEIRRLRSELDQIRREAVGALERIAYEPIGEPDATHATVLNSVTLIARTTLAKINRG